MGHIHKGIFIPHAPRSTAYSQRERESFRREVGGGGDLAVESIIRVPSRIQTNKNGRRTPTSLEVLT